MNYPKPPLHTSRSLQWHRRMQNASQSERLVSGPGYRIKRGTKGVGLELIQRPSITTVFHPFKVYSTGEIDDDGKLGYQVRNGLVEFRPLFHMPGSVGTVPYAGAQFGFYGCVLIPDDCDSAFTHDQSEVLTPATFWLDPEPEMIGDLNYGSYYAFWVEIRPDTDNGSTWDGSVSIQYHRFSLYGLGGGGSAYDSYAYPGIPHPSGYETLPIAIVQVTAARASAPFLGVDSGDGLVLQHKSDNYISRFPAGQNGYAGFSWQGVWGTDPGTDSGNRVWYPGDMVQYDGWPALDTRNGLYFWSSGAGQLGGTPTSPFDGASAFVQAWDGT